MKDPAQVPHTFPIQEFIGHPLHEGDVADVYVLIEHKHIVFSCNNHYNNFITKLLHFHNYILFRRI